MSHGSLVRKVKNRIHQLFNVRGDNTGKMSSGSVYHRDPEHKMIIVVEREYTNLFRVLLSPTQEGLKESNQTFSRKELEKEILQAKNGRVYFAIKKNVGSIKTVCLKNFLSEGQ